MARRSYKPKVPGDSIPFRIRKDGDERLIEWINEQSNFTESIRFLIELAIAKDGITDYGTVVPSVRSEKFLENYLKNQGMNVVYNTSIPQQEAPASQVEKEISNDIESASVKQNDDKNGIVEKEAIQFSREVSVAKESPKVEEVNNLNSTTEGKEIETGKNQDEEFNTKNTVSSKTAEQRQKQDATSSSSKKDDAIAQAAIDSIVDMF
ncbi:hypothetical protein SFC65_20290 [Priestia filamentosa]|uniref:hypothetical protein n=1 Tax=Priestia filamentosa TaxID=1402861 RepID=UPI003982D63B